MLLRESRATLEVTACQILAILRITRKIVKAEGPGLTQSF